MFTGEMKTLQKTKYIILMPHEFLEFKMISGKLIL